MFRLILYFQKHGKCPTKYVQQSQGQMWICRRKWCDLVFYHPDLPQLVIRQEPINAVVAGLKSGVKDLINRRDTVLSVLREYAGLPSKNREDGTESINAVALLPTNLNEEAPVF